ncbi:MAG: type II secretion system protein GspN [Thermodesulfobacteriota bacterium]
MLKKVLTTVGVVVGVAVVAYVSAFFIFPDELIEDRIARSVRDGAGVEIKSAGFRKVFPFSLEAEGLVASDLGDPSKVVYIKRLRMGFSPLHLLTGRALVRLKGVVGRGGFAGTAVLTPAGAALRLRARDMDLMELLSLSKTYIAVTGTLSGDVDLRLPAAGCPEGTVSLRGGGFGAESLFYMGFNVPMGKVTGAGLELEMAGCRARIKGLWVDGELLSARVGGVVTMTRPMERSPLDLTLELTTRGALAGSDTLTAILKPYRKSANFYSARVRGTLAAPVMRPD